MTQTWKRIDDGADWGYERQDGGVKILDNGAGLGSAKGSGRWALVVRGKWIANIDTLAEAKALGGKEDS